MNDLDAKIAELKGWSISGNTITAPADLFGYMEQDPERFWWSTSDAKAFELVDELRAVGWFFSMQDMRDKTWRACFVNDGAGHTGMQAGPTRPEAICRAYIAAREWMAGKEKRG